MKKLALIYNPYAGKGKIKTHLADIIDIFSDNGFEITVIPTKGKGHCRSFIQTDGTRFDKICVAGGDGTVNEAFNALMVLGDKKPHLGYIPAGTTNDFASSCMIPTDPLLAAKVASGDKITEIDAGRFNEEYFSYVAAFGAFTSVAYGTSQQIKNLFGRAAYIVEGIKSLANVKSYKMRVKCNGEEFEDEFIFGMVANSNSVGGLKIKSLQVDLSDGLFEVLLFKKIGKATDVNAIVSDLLAKKTVSEYYYIFKTERLELFCEDAVAWTLDGEFGGEHNSAVIENVPRVIKIAVAGE